MVAEVVENIFAGLEAVEEEEVGQVGLAFARIVVELWVVWEVDEE